MQPCQVTRWGEKKRKGFTGNQGFGGIPFLLSGAGVMNGVHEIIAAIMSHCRVRLAVESALSMSSHSGKSFSHHFLLWSFRRPTGVTWPTTAPASGRLALFFARLVGPFILRRILSNSVRTYSRRDAAQGYRHIGKQSTDHGRAAVV